MGYGVDPNMLIAYIVYNTLTTKQDHAENARAFYAKVRGKAST